MARTKIELYNLDKYSPYIPAPVIDRVEGNADEIILSADGYEDSASSGLPGSLTINASGGVWTDTNYMVTCETSHKYTTTTELTQETFLSFDKQDFRSAIIDITIQKGNNFTTKRLTVIHNNSLVTVHEGTSVSVPETTIWNEQISGNINGNNIDLHVSGLTSNSIISCICKYTLV